MFKHMIFRTCCDTLAQMEVMLHEVEGRDSRKDMCVHAWGAGIAVFQCARILFLSVRGGVCVFFFPNVLCGTCE